MDVWTADRTQTWVRLLKPWTTPLEPQTWLRTWLRPATSSAEQSRGCASDEIPEGGPSVTWNLRRFEADGEEHETILELLERKGEQPRFGCRRGVCRRCIVPLRAGRVRDLRDGRNIDAGTHVRICVSAPLDQVEIDEAERPHDSTRARTEVTL